MHPAPPTRAEIEAGIAQVQRGSIEAYQVVVEAYQRRLRGLVASWCPPAVDPDEIAHLAFVQAYKQIDRYEPGTRFFAWLAAIARNLLLAELKRIEREGQGRRRYLDVLLAQGLGQRLAQKGELEEERIEALRQCAGQLEPRARDVLRMRYAGEESVKGIATATGKSVAAVKFQLFRIRQILRECVERKLGLAGEGS